MHVRFYVYFDLPRLTALQLIDFGHQTPRLPGPLLFMILIAHRVRIAPRSDPEQAGMRPETRPDLELITCHAAKAAG